MVQYIRLCGSKTQSFWFYRRNNQSVPNKSWKIDNNYLDDDGDSNQKLNALIYSDLKDFLKDESYAPNIDIGLLTSENFR